MVPRDGTLLMKLMVAPAAANLFWVFVDALIYTGGASNRISTELRSAIEYQNKRET